MQYRDIILVEEQCTVKRKSHCSFRIGYESPNYSLGEVNNSDARFNLE
mgnify:CR=1 FL=1